MKTPLIILFYVIGLLSALPVTGQSYFKDSNFSFGFSFQKQDRRLFDFPHGDEIIANEKSYYDYQFELSLNKDFFIKNKFSSAFGFGYSLNILKFSRPFDHNYFDEQGLYILRYIQHYSIHNIRIYDNLKYELFGNDDYKLSLIVPVGFNIAFNKHIKAIHSKWEENKWIFELNNIDIYSGLQYKTGKFSFDLSYRLFDIQKIDHVIFTPLLTNDNTHADIIRDQYEYNRIHNLKMNIGYTF